MAPRPFISYAREDRAHAEKLYVDLRRSGVEPWLDITHIVAGEYWPTVVRTAIRHASNVILLISRRSLAKEGWVQREVREAIERLKNMPEGSNLIIPVLLEPVDPPFEDLRSIERVELYADYDEGFSRIMEALRFSETGRVSAARTVAGEKLKVELQNLTKVNVSTSRDFSEPLETREAVYAEAIRLVINAGINDTCRATATLFDRRETTDDLFRTYLNLIAEKCREAASHEGSFEHHALFAFRRDEDGKIPDGVRAGLELRRQVFEAYGVIDRLHLYQINHAMLDMLLVGRDRAVIAFPESPASSRLQKGISAAGLEQVSSLVMWYDAIQATAMRL